MNPGIASERDPAANGPAATELIGYVDRLSVKPGGIVRFMVSTDLEAYGAQLMRLRHGDRNPAGPGFRATELPELLNLSLPGRKQHGIIGSFALSTFPSTIGAPPSFSVGAWIWPTLPRAGRRQGIVALDRTFALTIEPGGQLALILEREGERHIAATSWAAEASVWTYVAASYASGSGVVTLYRKTSDPRATHAGESVEQQRLVCPEPSGTARHATIAAQSAGEPATDALRPQALYNGKIEAPWIAPYALAPGALGDLSDAAEQTGDARLLAAWDLSPTGSPDQVMDRSAHARHARLINLPTRGVTGHAWDGTESDFRRAPHQYAAIHFHDDDLEDARWDADFEVTFPDDMPSGVYAARLRGAGAEDDHVPVIVRPRLGEPSAEVALLLPTFTYLAYANERLLSRAEDLFGATGAQMLAGVAGPADRYLATRPDLGLSLYDAHCDGSGVCYSSHLRPIPNMRPDYRFWQIGGPERFAADLYIVDWLEQFGFAHDVITDGDLHEDGLPLIASYRVLLTGTHPEYWTGAMLQALSAYLARGGRVMYLGGNGFYWVTGVDPARPHVIEVRRGINGNRAWESRPGEIHMTTSGEQGGIWRYRGHPPNHLVGIGYGSQTYSRAPAAGYARTRTSYEPELAWIFDGVDDPVIGEFGLIGGGAAGYELDRFDHALGTPWRARLLASSAGRHNRAYLVVVEDLLTTQLDQDGETNDHVRADLAYLPYPNGGGAFSVGSVTWCAALSHNGYRNNVSQITENVLRRFLA